MKKTLQTLQHSQNTDIQAPVGSEPVIPASEWSQIHRLDGATFGVGTIEGDINMNNSRGRKRIYPWLTWDLPVFLVDEKGYNFEAEWP